MALDDPHKPEFASWASYGNFCQRVQQRRRYIWEKEVRAFLNTVLATLKDRDVEISKGKVFYRAQRGVEWEDDFQSDIKVGEKPYAFGSKRMKPLPNRAKEGRVNAAGIPVLYLASSVQTAISEVRPWVGVMASVAQFKIVRDLKAANLSLGHGEWSAGHLKIGDEEPTPEEKERAVWIDIDNAFSHPVTGSDDAADYVPTQILAELFRDAGYDAVIYRSQFGEKGYNIALFNLGDAEAINGTPYEVTGIEVKFKEAGDISFYTKYAEYAETKKKTKLE